VVAAGDGLAHSAQGAAELGLVGAIDGRLGDGLTCALQGRDMICHTKTLFLTAIWREMGCRPEAVGHSALSRFRQLCRVPLQLPILWVFQGGVNEIVWICAR
jgi:hypothetical protein